MGTRERTPLHTPFVFCIIQPKLFQTKQFLSRNFRNLGILNSFIHPPRTVEEVGPADSRNFTRDPRSEPLGKC